MKKRKSRVYVVGQKSKHNVVVEVVVSKDWGQKLQEKIVRGIEFCLALGGPVNDG